MRILILAAAVSALPLGMAVAQTNPAPSITLYELPGFLGRSVVISGTNYDLEQLDAGDGVNGQDVTFFARPTLGDIQVSAGTNDLSSAGAFCQRAGFGAAAYASRARVQVSNIIDASRGTRLRAFPLRDVLCRR